MWSVGGILDNKATDRDEYYKILGCDENSTEEQISTEYKLLALKCHPDKNCGNENALAEFQILQEARDTLTDPEKRRKYDTWRRSDICMSYKQWLGLSSRFKPTMHWIQPKSQVMLEGQPGQAEVNPDLQENQTWRQGNMDPNNEQMQFNIHDHGITNLSKQSRKDWGSDGRAVNGVYNQFRNYQI